MLDIQPIVCRKAVADDFDAIWEIFHRVVATGDSYTFAPDTTKEEAHLLWMPAGPKDKKVTYVALRENKIVGTYFLRPNQPALGAHVANAGYMVHPDYQGYGIGKTMALHSFTEAKQQGYLAMQYNIVVSTNTAAVALWQKLGFKIIGTTPKAFQHKVHGLVDTYIMHRFLD